MIVQPWEETMRASLARILFRGSIAATAMIATAVHAADPPKDVKLYVFSSGALTLDKSILQNGSSGKVSIPVGFFLIRHPKGDVLFDCGNNDRIITNPDYWGPLIGGLDPVRTPDVAIDTQLAKINVKPADVKYVVLGRDYECIHLTKRLASAGASSLSRNSNAGLSMTLQDSSAARKVPSKPQGSGNFPKNNSCHR